MGRTVDSSNLALLTKLCNIVHLIKVCFYNIFTLDFYNDFTK